MISFKTYNMKESSYIHSSFGFQKRLLKTWRTASLIFAGSSSPRPWDSIKTLWIPLPHPSPLPECVTPIRPLLTETLWSRWPSALCACYGSPKVFWRRHIIIFTGIIENFPKRNWERCLVFLFIVQNSMVYFWKITMSPWEK